jgi:hypothetical protein
MKSIIELIDTLYRSAEFSNNLGKYELSILQGVKRDIAWSNLTDSEKLEYRKRDLVHKEKVKAIISDAVISYEEAVIELGYLILNFLEATNIRFPDLNGLPTKSKEEITLFRLRTMLYCELYSINKHRNLENGGHVLYAEVIDPILVELETSKAYQEYDLPKIRDVYKRVTALYNSKPYTSA